MWLGKLPEPEETLDRAVWEFGQSGLSGVDIVDLRSVLPKPDRIIKCFDVFLASKEAWAFSFLEDYHTNILSQFADMQERLRIPEEEAKFYVEGNGDFEDVVEILYSAKILFACSMAAIYHNKALNHWFCESGKNSARDPDKKTPLHDFDLAAERRLVNEFCPEWLWPEIIAANPFIAAWLKTAKQRQRFILFLADVPEIIAYSLRSLLGADNCLHCGVISPQQDTSYGLIDAFRKKINTDSVFEDSDVLYAEEGALQAAFGYRRLFLVNPTFQERRQFHSPNVCFGTYWVKSDRNVGTRIFDVDMDKMVEIDPSEIGLSEVVRIADGLCGIKR